MQAQMQAMLRAMAAGARRRGGRALLASSSLLGGSLLYTTLKPPVRAEAQEPLSTQSLSDRMVQTLGLKSWIDWVVEPADRAGLPPGKLLPDPPETGPSFTHRTLVLSLEDTLVNTEWDRKRGHRTKKRPGLDAFLAHMSQTYEIVIFTSAMSSYAQPIVMRLAEQQPYFEHSLYREHTKYVNGKHIKDLSFLNRDLRKVIIVDTNSVSYSYQPDNAVAIKPWNGDLNDTELIDLIPFLEAIAKEDIQDVREVIRSFHGTNVPEKFRKLRQQAVERKKKGVIPSAVSALLHFRLTSFSGTIVGSLVKVPHGVLPVLTPILTRTHAHHAPHVLHAPKAPPKPAE